jgi:pyroglutamyl-peptidase
MKILLTAFGPFGGESVNPAEKAVELVPATIKGVQISKIEVPVVFGKAIETTYKAMKEQQPDVVLCIGQAGGRFAVTPERVGINIRNARIPDNEGNQPFGQPIFADGPDGYFSLLPINEMVEAIKKAGVPAEVSDTAGTYVCNDLMYGVLYHIHHEFPKMKGGFMHVPYLTEQVLTKKNTPALSLEQITAAITAAVTAIIDHQ